MYKIPVVKIQMVKDGSIACDKRKKAIRTPSDAFDIMYPVCELLAEESFYVLLLDTKNNVNGIHEVSHGSLNASIVHPREVFKSAVLSNAASIICVHNHPSGDPAPSQEDITITKRLVECGKMMDIPVLDHVIIGDERYVSLKEKGII